MPGKCNQNGVVYQATVTTATGRVETYVGLAKNFKKRYPKHKKCMLDESAEGQTALTKYYWQEKNAGGTLTYHGNSWRQMFQFLTQSQTDVGFAFVKSSILF